MPTEFLNSRSMLTPGAAGGLTMFITSTLAFQFGFSPKWTALAISFVIGLLVLADSTVKRRLVRGALYVVNSLIIFAVAAGANGVAYGLSAPAPREAPVAQGARFLPTAVEEAREAIADAASESDGELVAAAPAQPSGRPTRAEARAFVRSWFDRPASENDMEAARADEGRR